MPTSLLVFGVEYHSGVRGPGRWAGVLTIYRVVQSDQLSYAPHLVVVSVELDLCKHSGAFHLPSLGAMMPAIFAGLPICVLVSSEAGLD